ncbi:hypothetical protein Gotur_006495 [Gossypium turneri]
MSLHVMIRALLLVGAALEWRKHMLSGKNYTANIIFKNDYLSLANRIRNQGVDITIMGQRINELFKSTDILKKAKFRWVNRNCNKVTNFMSEFTITNNCILNFGMDYPSAVHDFVIVDAIN